MRRRQTWGDLAKIAELLRPQRSLSPRRFRSFPRASGTLHGFQDLREAAKQRRPAAYECRERRSRCSGGEEMAPPPLPKAKYNGAPQDRPPHERGRDCPYFALVTAQGGTPVVLPARVP